MCGRYAFFQRPAQIRQQLREANLPCQTAPDDDDVRLSYNFAPGYYGLVYRAQTGDSGGNTREDGQDQTDHAASDEKPCKAIASGDEEDVNEASEPGYKLQAMKWGLIPFWTKRNPDYGSMMKTINCRDDSLIEDRGMWTTMKKRKRCIVVCQGFYEWLKKNNGKERIPHYIKRKDNMLLCLAGLWDCVKYEDSEERHYTYSIITTDSNKQLKFLHDRMPVIFDAGSEQMRLWLDPTRTEWGKDLQSLLKPFNGELEIYPVNKDVGKVGNNSPTFIVPLDSAENKSNIVNFFNNQKKAAKGDEVRKNIVKTEEDIEMKGTTVEGDPYENRETINKDSNTETHAPMPTPSKGIKREHSDDDDQFSLQGSPPSKERKVSTNKSVSSISTRRSRNAMSNGTKSPTKTNGSQKITKFFGN